MLEFRGSPWREGSGVGRVGQGLAVGTGRRSWRAFNWVEHFDCALFPRLELGHVSSGVSRGGIVFFNTCQKQRGLGRVTLR